MVLVARVVLALRLMPYTYPVPAVDAEAAMPIMELAFVANEADAVTLAPLACPVPAVTADA